MTKKMYIEVQNLPLKHHKYMAQDGDGGWNYFVGVPIFRYNAIWSAIKGSYKYAGRSVLRKGWNKYYYEIIR